MADEFGEAIGFVPDSAAPAAAAEAPVRGSRRSGDLVSFALEEAERLGLDQNIVRRMVAMESGGRPDAVSPRGAFGPMQLMPGTARELSARYGGDPADPHDNIRLGLRYLRDSLNEFGGDYNKAVAAYQAGPGAVRRHDGPVPWGDGITSNADYVARIVGGDAPAGGERVRRTRRNQVREPDIHPSTFGDALGFLSEQPPAPGRQALGAATPRRTPLDYANDIVVDGVNAAAGIIKTVPDLVLPGNPVSEAIDSFIKMGEQNQSDWKKASRAKLAADLERVKDSEIDKFTTYVRHALTEDPLGLVAEAAGNLGVFGAIGKGLRGAGWSYGAIRNAMSGITAAVAAGEVRGNIYDKIQKIPDADLQEVNPDYARLRASGVSEQDAKRDFGRRFVERLPELTGAALFGALGGRFGAEGMAAGVGPNLGRIASGVVGAIEEGAQGAVEQLATNVGVRRTDPRQSLTEDIGLNVAAEGLPGGVIGVAAGGRRPTGRPGAAPASADEAVSIDDVLGPAPNTSTSGGPSRSQVDRAVASATPPALEPVQEGPTRDELAGRLAEIGERQAQLEEASQAARERGADERTRLRATDARVEWRKLETERQRIVEQLGGEDATTESVRGQGTAESAPIDEATELRDTVGRVVQAIEGRGNFVAQQDVDEITAQVQEIRARLDGPEREQALGELVASRVAPAADPNDPFGEAVGLIEPEEISPEKVVRDQLREELSRLTKPKRSRDVDAENDDLLSAIAKLGGLQRNEAVGTWGLDPKDFKYQAIVGKPLLRAKGGLTLDDMAEKLVELGYLERRDLADFERVFDRAVRGERIVTAVGAELDAQREQDLSELAELNAKEEEEAGFSDFERELLDELERQALDTLGESEIERMKERAAMESEGRGLGAYQESLYSQLRSAIDEALANAQARLEGPAPGATPEDRSGGGETARAPPSEQPAQAEGFELAPQTPEGLRALDAAVKARQEDQRRADERASAPPPETFTLTGSSRPADEARARGQLELTDQPSLGLNAQPSPAPERKPFAAEIAELKRNRDARRKAIADAVEDGSVRLTSEKMGKALISPEPGREGRYRITRFDGNTPTGHTEYNSLDEAINDAAPSYEPDLRAEDEKRVTIKRLERGDFVVWSNGENGAERIGKVLRVHDDHVDLGTGRDYGVGITVPRGDVLRIATPVEQATLWFNEPKPSKTKQGRKPAASASKKGAVAAEAEKLKEKKARADLDAALADLADIFGKDAKKNITPEQEQRLLPVLTRVFDAAFRLGHIKFKQAAQFVLDTIREKLGADVAGQVSIDHLQGAYIGMAGKYREQGADSKRDVVAIESIDEIRDARQAEPETIDPTPEPSAREEQAASDPIAEAGFKFLPPNVWARTIESDGTRYLFIVRRFGLEGEKKYRLSVSASFPGRQVTGAPTMELGIFVSADDVAKAAVAQIEKRSPKAELGAVVDAAARDAATSPDNDRALPTRGQTEAGNYKKPPIALHGMQIRIENPKGSVRSNIDLGALERAVARPDGALVGKRAEKNVRVALREIADEEGELLTARRSLRDVLEHAPKDSVDYQVVSAAMPAKDKPWISRMQAHYGYIRRTEGADGDPVDVYIGPQPELDVAFIIGQRIVGSTKFDEHKVMLGFPRGREAYDAWADSFEDGFAARIFDQISGPYTIAKLKELLPTLKKSAPARPAPPSKNEEPLPPVAGDPLDARPDPIVEGATNAGISGNTESDRGDGAGASEPVRAGVVPTRSRRSGRGARSPSASDGESRRDADDGARVSDRRPAAIGEPGNLGLFDQDGQQRVAPSPAGSDERGRSLEPGDEGVSDANGIGDEEALANAQANRTGVERRQRAQSRVAARFTPSWADAESIAATVPILLPEQQDDVAFVEQRLFGADGEGVLLTNGTGTGKTFSALGLARRVYGAGHDNILVLAPKEEVITAWVASAKMIGMPFEPLADTKSNGGKGPVITTYANFGANESLHKRQWNLVIADESHYLSSAQDGRGTDALAMMRALTWHKRGVWKWMDLKVRERDPQLMARMDAARADRKPAAEADVKAWAAMREEFMPQYEALSHASVRPIATHPKVLLLSATPFSYHKSLDYAEGYLFHYDQDRAQTGFEKPTSYNSPSAYESFFITNLGYRMRYNKLTAPDAEVNVALMEQNLNQRLKDDKVLRGRKLEVDQDYDRRFMLVEDEVGAKIDEGIKWLDENMRPLADVVRKKFDYLRRQFLLEALKAKHAVPDIRRHLALGRKVVVFHDYNVGGGFHPFKLSASEDAEATWYESGADGKLEAKSAKVADLIAEFEAKRPDLTNEDLFASISSPLTTMAREFPDALYINGTMTKAKRRPVVKAFNDDDSGRNLVVVQSEAGREGISLHDTTGRHQRVIINLGMPPRPVAIPQIEGRIYRVGQASDAIFRYYTTGTNWERWTFASKIAERAEAAENLALGVEARGLKNAIISAFNDAEFFEPRAGEGKGGKALDRAFNVQNALAPFERAKTYYFAQQKKTSRNKAAEGIDYFATPEPLGLKMVEWADIRSGESVLEPSAGHGAIARFFPDDAKVTMVEPSDDLASRAALVRGDARIERMRFEELHVGANKFDAIVMNPPFGVGGKTAIEHMAKAVQHLKNGGRIVAIYPRGPAADKRLDAFLYDENAEEPLPIYKVGEIILPSVTFERAGTSAAARVLILERHDAPESAAHVQQFSDRDLSDAKTIGELFERIEHMGAPQRIAPPKVATPPEASAAAAPATGFTVKDTKHGKTGKALFNASLNKRVAYETYGKLNALAKKHDGFYSRFDKAFQFSTADNRAAFMVAAEGILTRPEVAASSSPLYDERYVQFATPAPIDEGRDRGGAAALPSGRSAPDAATSEQRKLRILANAITRQFERAGRAVLVGQRIESPEDLAALAQIYRNPQVETFRLFFTRGNEIVYATGVSARLPGNTAAFPSDLNDWQGWMRSVMRASGADGYYMLHNHPNGDPKPSASDVRASFEIARKMPGFRGHVIIDSNRYALIEPREAPEVVDVKGNYDDYVKLKWFGEDALLKASQPHAFLGRKIGGPAQLAALGKSFQRPGFVTLIGQNATGVRSIAEVPVATYTNPVYARAAIRRLARVSGSDMVFAVGDSTDLVAGKSDALIREGFLYDAADPEGRSYRAAGVTGEPGTHFGQRKGELRAAFVRQRAVDVSPADKLLSEPVSTGPLETLARGMFERTGVSKATSAAWDTLLTKAGEWVPETVKAGVVDKYGLTEPYKQRRALTFAHIRSGFREGARFIENLSGVTLAESRIMWEWMTNPQARTVDMEARLKPEQLERLRSMRQFIDAMGAEAVRLGDLSADTYDRNKGAYLHRSYLKHEVEATASEKASRARTIRVLGDQYRMRGLKHEALAEQVLSTLPKEWGLRLKKRGLEAAFLGQRFIRFERYQNRGEGTATLEGMPTPAGRGKLLEVAYWPVGEPIPKRFDDWYREQTWEARWVRGDRIVMHRDFTPAEQEEMGRIAEVRFAVARTLQKMVHDVEVSKFFEWTADREALPEQRLPAGAVKVEGREALWKAYGKDDWVKVPETEVAGTGVKRYGKLAGLYVPGPVWNDVRQVRNPRFGPDWFNAMMRGWKISKTALSPTVHMNNVMANVVMADWHDLTARDIWTALQVMRDADNPAHKETIERFEDAGGTQGMYVLSEIQRDQLAPLLDEIRGQLTHENNVSELVRVSQIAALLGEMRLRDAWDKAGYSAPAKWGKGVVKFLMDAYENEDRVFRLAAFIRAKREGKTDVEAGKVARESFLDYDINAPWIQMARGTLFPFISFTYRAVPMLARTAAEKPWKLLKLGLVVGALNALGYLAAGGDEDDERERLPDEKRGKVWGFLVPKLVRMGWNDGGHPVFLDIRRFVPVGDIVDVDQSHAALPLPPAMTPGGPLAILSEVVLNRVGFTGRPITQETDTIGEVTQKVLKHLWTAFAPNLIGLPGVPATDKLMKAATGETGAFGQEVTLAMAVGSAIGIKLEPYAADVALQRMSVEMGRNRREVEANIRRAARSAAAGGITQSDLREKVDSESAKLRALNEKIAARMRAVQESETRRAQR